MKLAVAAVALAVSSLAAAPRAASPVSYAGRWTLDRAQSRGLPDFYARVRSHRLVVAQTPAQLDVFVEIDLGDAAPDTLRFVYPLDGTEARTTALIRLPNGPTSVPATLRATADADGTVHVAIVRTIPMPSGPVTAATNEDWHLSADGRTLTIDRADDTPRGPIRGTMVFVKG